MKSHVIPKRKTGPVIFINTIGFKCIVHMSTANACDLVE
jgi:hypothetical protein